jgi:ornithine cyclodeaminase/alanine dehydrogenase-like protein (mu-crystallin family)
VPSTDRHSGPAIRVLGATEIAGLVDLDDVVRTQDAAFRRLADGTGQLAARQLLDDETNGSTAFCYSARTAPGAGAVCKFGSVNPENGQSGIATVSATVLALDPHTGRLAALLDGEAVTTLRTPAASVVAARQLVRSGPIRLAVLGSGVQARAHATALCAGLTAGSAGSAGSAVESLTVWSPAAGRRSGAVSDLRSRLTADVAEGGSAETAVAEADLVVTATTSRTPVVRAEWLRPGATVLSLGSFAPDRHEYGPDVLDRADVIAVDDPDTALRQSGPLAAAVASGSLVPERVVGLGELLLGRRPGRTRDDQVVLYTSVGLGIQDAALAELLLARAHERGVGRLVSLA